MFCTCTHTHLVYRDEWTVSPSPRTQALLRLQETDRRRLSTERLARPRVAHRLSHLRRVPATPGRELHLLHQEWQTLLQE